ncbi:hypothetical protein [Dysgonomonas termitidis]|uniref:Uncharacterized protein n=1 Tax=Dysgonomonas termitidis TaxID=1516126 RepID=A0ABV9L3D4_9BACT
MRKITLLIIALLAIVTIAFAQNQTINGNLHVANTSGGNLRIGKVGDIGNKNVPVGGLTAQYNFDFTGYRDVVTDQIGARIAALRFNKYQEGNALMQKTALAFYTNLSGTNAGATDLVERMRITPEGNVGIGTVNPVATLDVLGTNGSSGNKNFRVLYKNGGALTNTEFSALASIPSLLAGGNNSWTALYAKQGSANKAGVFEGDVFITNNVGIGVTNPTSKLEVNGTIRAKEVKIEVTGWADFVLGKDYDLPKLSEVENHINDKQHLPGIPSEKEVLENGVNVVDMQAKLLQKIEELTLYMIEQDKQNKELKQRLSIQETELNNLKKTLK